MTRGVTARAGLLAAALAIGLGGMALELRLLVWVAAGLLGVAVVLRLILRRRDPA